MLFGWLKNKSQKKLMENSDKILTLHEKTILLQEWQVPPSLSPLNENDLKLLDEIKSRTLQSNRNNITRTQAYLDIYLNHPELHWAFLAHMVSRNAGWNMTDLKRHSLSGLMGFDSSSIFFGFLEKGNHLIFQDAFPQLSLYAEGKRQNQDFSHLLGHIGVSSFMLPFWRLFLKDGGKNSRLLTVSLIINEQSLLQKHVMNNPYYQEKVLNSLKFQLQEKLGFTQILFPYKHRNLIEITGGTVANFASLPSRIEFGKELYMRLFSDPEVLQGAVAFGKDNFHTGSRSDYMPKVFSTDADSLKVYSPHLENAWPTHLHKSTKKLEDWFSFDKANELPGLFTLSGQKDIPNMKEEHLLNIMQLSSLGEIHKLMT
ncbi:hypothetical protein JOC95_001230 [Bacillus tianshenii]|uniref:DUF2515 domain-containing protein n=1 Tax=Sutcliffiella tianshenii TaxID=1463404 RepID=A0ABS2NXH9_9BACI|nr:DUF2515 family protein [Bacillus tianshenii]MBM7619381.1 hypothetical protein [Bacillus tianshenii]